MLAAVGRSRCMSVTDVEYVLGAGPPYVYPDPEIRTGKYVLGFTYRVNWSRAQLFARLQHVRPRLPDYPVFLPFPVFPAGAKIRASGNRVQGRCQPIACDDPQGRP